MGSTTQKRHIETGKSLASSFNSGSISVTKTSEVAFLLASSGVTTNTGTLKLQHQIDVDANNTSDWCDITFAPVPTFVNADNQFLLQATLPPGKTRLVYTSADYQVDTLTFPAKASAANGDYVVVENPAGTKWAVALVKPVAEVQTLTFPAKASITDGDFIVITDGSGVVWAFAADTTGGAAQTPTGAVWTAIAAGNKTYYDISGATTGADVAALAETALNALTGFTAAVTTDDSAADGTMQLTMVVKAPCADPDPHDYNDAGAGSLSGVEDTAGVASQTPTGAAWTAADYKGLADISSDTTAAQVAARAETAFNALTGFTTAITSNDTAADGTMTLTMTTTGPATAPDPHTYNDGGAGSISGTVTSVGDGTCEVYASVGEI